MILWATINGRHDAKSSHQGGTFATLERDGEAWVVAWWVGPRGRYLVPSEAKGRIWVERFAGRRLTNLGREAATPGLCPYDGRGASAPVLTPEEKARYDAISALYVPGRAKKRRSRR